MQKIPSIKKKLEFNKLFSQKIQQKNYQKMQNSFVLNKQIIDSSMKIKKNITRFDFFDI